MFKLNQYSVNLNVSKRVQCMTIKLWSGKLFFLFLYSFNFHWKTDEWKGGQTDEKSYIIIYIIPCENERMLVPGRSVFSSLPYCGASVMTYIILSAGVSVSVALSSLTVMRFETSEPVYSRNCRPRFTSMTGLPSSRGKMSMWNSWKRDKVIKFFKILTISTKSKQTLQLFLLQWWGYIDFCSLVLEELADPGQISSNCTM